MAPDQLRYLLVLALCLAITLPLEFLGARVYRSPLRTIKSVLPVAVVFLVWDVVAIAGGVWSFDARRISGVEVLGHLPLEEVLFFAVVPLCALLTFGCVEALLAALRRTRRAPARKEGAP